MVIHNKLPIVEDAYTFIDPVWYLKDIDAQSPMSTNGWDHFIAINPYILANLSGPSL